MKDGKKLIMIADDEGDIRDILRILLTGDGYLDIYGLLYSLCSVLYCLLPFFDGTEILLHSCSYERS